jgi:hypothetical protein
MANRPTEALRSLAHLFPSDPDDGRRDELRKILDSLDAAIAAKDARIAELNRCVGLIRCADAYGIDPKNADAGRYLSDALRLANDLYEESPDA